MKSAVFLQDNYEISHATIFLFIYVHSVFTAQFTYG